MKGFMAEATNDEVVVSFAFSSNDARSLQKLASLLQVAEFMAKPGSRLSDRVAAERALVEVLVVREREREFEAAERSTPAAPREELPADAAQSRTETTEA